MKVYVALSDLNGNFLVAKKRGLNRWRDRKVFPVTQLLDDAWQYCFPGGEQGRDETLIMAAARIFWDQTGHQIPVIHHCSRTFERDRYALVCFTVHGINAFRAAINKGLIPLSSNPASPSNTGIVDWELAHLLMVSKHNLDRVLGIMSLTEISSNRPAGGDRSQSGSLARYKEMARLLKDAY